MKKKIRNPKHFGINDTIQSCSFKVEPDDHVVMICPTLVEDGIAMSPKLSRWLANKLNISADYLEQYAERKNK